MGPQTHIQWNTWMNIRPGIRLNLYDFTPGQPDQKFDRNGAYATFELEFTLQGTWCLEMGDSGEKTYRMINKRDTKGPWPFSQRCSKHSKSQRNSGGRYS